MANIGPNSPSIEQLVASGTREIIASVENQRAEMLLRNREMLYESEKRITENIQRSEQSISARLENTKTPESKPWQLLVALLPSVLTILLGVVVWVLQIKTNQKIDTSSKQVSTRLALTEEYYKRQYTVYDNAYKRMLQLLTAVQNVNPEDTKTKTEAENRLTQLNLWSQTNGLYMTKDVSDGLLDVWFTATQLPQLNLKGTSDIGELKAKTSAVEDKMRDELLGNIGPLKEEGR
jgi:hypothetical protein